MQEEPATWTSVSPRTPAVRRAFQMRAHIRLIATVQLAFGTLLPAAEASAAVVSAHVVVQSVRLTDNGDDDGFADPNETVSVYVTLRNRSGSDRNGIVVRMASAEPAVACIPTPIVSFGSLLSGEVREATVPLVFRAADVARLDPFQDLSVTLDFVVSGDDFGTTTRPQSVTLDVDLNASGGLLPTSYTEGFENAGFGSFTTQSLDAGRESLAASDGFRCQYNDPDFANSNTPGSTFCYLGAPSPAQNAYDWHIHGLASPDGGRAYLGNNSLHWGVHPGAASADTTRLRQLDAIRTINPVNLGWNGITPELSFKHQVGLPDCDYHQCDPGQTSDRGVVQVQLSNVGQGVGSWRKISPYENVYDSQTIEGFSICLFDPTDDGTTEDDYFDPTDPGRRLGPSSTCFPEFGFSRQGAIAFDAVFDENAIGHASDGPGLQGSRGPGTWVETKFSLARWRGRRLRVRFLVTSPQIWDWLTTQDSNGWNPSPGDDGWYIDDVRITNTLISAATVSVDTADRSGLPSCGPVCAKVTPSLVAAPTTTNCGEAFDLDASGSTADQCPGPLQFRFWWIWPDLFPTGSLSENDRNASLLQDWNENGTFSDTRTEAPMLRYQVDVRCSTLPACEASTTRVVPVDPSSYTSTPFPYTIGFFDGPLALSWGAGTRFAAVRGDLGALRASGGNFTGSVQTCLARSRDGDVLFDDMVPGPGEGLYYLLKTGFTGSHCQFYSWSTGSAAEAPGAGGNRDQDLALDTNGCGL